MKQAPVLSGGGCDAAALLLAGARDPAAMTSYLEPVRSSR